LVTIKVSGDHVNDADDGVVANLTHSFQVYRGLLCFHSGYFNNLLTGGFREAGSAEITIKDVSVEVFKTVLFWLNTGKLYSQYAPPFEHRFIFELFVFADKYVMPRLKNNVVEAFAERLFRKFQCPNRTDVAYLYDNTIAGSPMSRILVDFYIKQSFNDHDEYEACHPAFLAEVLRTVRNNSVRIARRVSEDATAWYKDFKDNRCDYHDHIEPNATRRPLKN
jgi:hypothetical protein